MKFRAENSDGSGNFSALTGQMLSTGQILLPPGQCCWRPTYGLAGTQGDVDDRSHWSDLWRWPRKGFRLGIGDFPDTGLPFLANLGWRSLGAPLVDGKRSQAGTES